MVRRLLHSLWRLVRVAVVVAGVVAGLVWVSRRRARLPEPPAPPAWPPLPGSAPATAGAAADVADVADVAAVPSVADPAAAPEVADEADVASVAEESARGLVPVVDAPDPMVALAPDPGGSSPTPSAAGGDAVVWVLAKDGACPEGYPVKAKSGSGIYHLPGMANYARTAPDRCYATAADAEADGFRPAKR